MAESRVTTDHDVIRRWVEERGGRPATVAGEEGAAALRIDFPDDSDGEERLEVISWNEFFDTFEEANLAFIYQEELVC
jgi:hypothetical protein